MWGRRLVVPQTCIGRVLNMVHEPHMGIVKSKSIARSYVWWPGVDEDVERMCRNCEVCASQADNPPQNAPSMWPWPNRPWARLHLDFMGPLGGKTYLVIVDATSKWIEIFNVHSTSARYTIDKLCELFSRWGLPKQIVSDNGPQFACKEFKDFTKSNGIEHIFTAPYHPASNGLAENAVRTMKRVIKKAIQSKQDIDRSLWAFLLHYRNVEHATTGECPALLLIGRRTRTRLDIIRPDREGRVFRAQQRQCEAAGGLTRQVSRGENVWYRQFQNREKWAPGKITDRLGARDFKVLTREGTLIHRHIDQLRKRPSGSLVPFSDMAEGSRSRIPYDLPQPRHHDREPVESSEDPTPINNPSEPQPEPSGLAQVHEQTSSISQQPSDPSANSLGPIRPVRLCRLNRPPIYKY
ncbi:hypothetical protein K1T71_010096 [Dendrolimus kikuchii]|uniref:Uncharacterized protein n=1 Tax=Dendrolimus kikuchii TaxID=765133 RepID=A0ACC1CQW8_9NEOP|nr:hypothetical protein K1T71_010096 [Dendrolimus kikuchii]